MMRAIKSATLVACFYLSAVAFAADWPCWHGPDRNNIAPDTGINKEWNARPPQELWRVSLSDDGYAGPSVAEGKVFIIDHQGDQDIVRALDLETGEDVWGSSYQDLGKANYGFSRAMPVFSEGRLYTISYLGKVHCLDAESGAKVWMRDMRSEFGGKRPEWGYAMSALVDGDKVIVCPGGDNASVAALNRDTGETIWAGGGSDLPGYATPVKATINGQDQYVVFTGVSLIGVSVDGGPALWRVPWVNKYKVNAATPVVAGNHIFITSDYGRGCAVVVVEPQGAAIKWENTQVRAHFSSPVYYHGCMFCNSNPGYLVCLNAATGGVIWKQQGFDKGGLIAVDGVIIALDGKRGDVVMVNATADGYQELGRFKPLGGQSWTAPIIADGKLIVRNKNAMVCLDLM